MSRVILVFGNPDNGKSTLANLLSSEHGFHPLTVDEIYVAFVQHTYQGLFFPDLGAYILQHYESTLKVDPSRQQAWWSHLASQIVGACAHHAKVVVEGYQLYDCKDAIEGLLKQRGEQVFQVKADGFTYTWSKGVSRPRRSWRCAQARRPEAARPPAASPTAVRY